MKLKTKILLAALSAVLLMSVLPWLAVHWAEGLATTGLWFFAFFAVNPLLAIALGALAGTRLKKLWWIPLSLAAAFPLLFGLAIGEMVWDLYFYSAIYLPLGLLSMLGSHLIKKLLSKK